jgi:hypothetical protein
MAMVGSSVYISVPKGDGVPRDPIIEKGLRVKMDGQERPNNGVKNPSADRQKLSA